MVSLNHIIYGDGRLRDFVNSTSKFSSIVVKTMKLVLCSPLDGIALNLKKNNLSRNIAYQHGFFQPTLDPSYISLDTLF
jgi:hypothetical protein